jgi:Asp/Glu/hydantoin racemase
LQLGHLEIKKNIQILRLVPISPRHGQEGPHQRRPIDYLSPTTRVDDIYCLGAPNAINSQATARQAKPFVLEKVKWAYEQDYDVVVIACMLDPGLQYAKRLAPIPVIGVREATLIVASLLGTNPAIIYPRGIQVKELAADPEATYEALIKAANWEIDYGADIMIPGCTRLGKLSQSLQKDLDIPVITNEALALKVAELIVQLGISSSFFLKGGKRKSLLRIRRMVSIVISKRKSLLRRIASIAMSKSRISKLLDR